MATRLRFPEKPQCAGSVFSGMVRVLRGLGEVFRRGGCDFHKSICARGLCSFSGVCCGLCGVCGAWEIDLWVKLVGILPAEARPLLPISRHSAVNPEFYR